MNKLNSKALINKAGYLCVIEIGSDRCKLTLSRSRPSTADPSDPSGPNTPSILDSVEIISGNEISSGPRLPKPMYDQCSVELMEDLILLIGGHDGTDVSAETWLFDGQEYVSGPNLKKVRIKC